MKRDLDAPMIDLDGKVFADKATLKTLCFTTLYQPIEGDQSLSMDKKMKQYALLQKINAGGVVDLSSDDIVLIKERSIKQPFSIIAIGRMCEMLEAEPKLESVPKESA